MGDKQRNIPYDDRSDEEKLRSNWKKATGLFEREDWSAAIVRASTSVELAANIYIRRFMSDYEVPVEIIDSLLLSANGINGKFQRLIKPAAQVNEQSAEFSTVGRKIQGINQHRNGVVHSGKFKRKRDATTVFSNSLDVIVHLAPSAATGLDLPFKR